MLRLHETALPGEWPSRAGFFYSQKRQLLEHYQPQVIHWSLLKWLGIAHPAALYGALSTSGA